jgi:hypothetical protein
MSAQTVPTKCLTPRKASQIETVERGFTDTSSRSNVPTNIRPLHINSCAVQPFRRTHASGPEEIRKPDAQNLVSDVFIHNQ